jgi:hypothetical protein
MKKLNLISTFLISIFMFSFCKKIFPDDNLSIQRENYSGNQLRLDGYYYRYINEEYYFPKLFFYNNGVILDIGGRFKTFEEVEDYINRIFIENSNYNSNKLSWGVYRVENDNIKFEKWYPGSGGGFPAITREGKILNDTTFHITQSYRMKNGKKREISAQDEIYHFKQFSPKPDSTNQFIR